MSAETTVSGAALRNDLPGSAIRVGILGSFALMLVLSVTRNVNWDEFYFLSHVHAWLDGRLDRPMQTFFVHGFGWLAWVPGTEVDQIVAARLVMVACVAVTCAAIFRIGSRLADPADARLAVLAYLASGFVSAHGASFRADPIAASLLMTALAVLMTTRMRAWQVMAVALLCAIALLVTVKSVLYLPAFLGALVWRWPNRALVGRGLVAGALAIGLAAVLYLSHSAVITVAAENATVANAREAVGTSLLSGELLPRRTEILQWGLLSLPALVLAGSALAAGSGRPGGDPAEASNIRRWVLLVALSLPLLSVVVYRNAFPYFFPFVSPPFMVLAAVGAAGLRRQGRLVPVVAAMLALATLQAVLAWREDNAAQRATLAEVHRLFPTPVPYIDPHGMVSSFPMQGFFMSTWGLDSYRAAGVPRFATIIADARPPLLLANRATMALAVRYGASRPGALLPEDQQVLHETYVHHAGTIWLAGRALTGTGGALRFTMPFAGHYRLEASGPVTIDGAAITPGTVLSLDASPHVLIAGNGIALRLVWATESPDEALPDLPEDGLYSGFWRL